MNTKILNFPGEQVMLYYPDGTIRIFRDKNAVDSETAKNVTSFPFIFAINMHEILKTTSVCSEESDYCAAAELISAAAFFLSDTPHRTHQAPESAPCMVGAFDGFM